MTERFLWEALIDHVAGEVGLPAPVAGAEVSQGMSCFVAGDRLFNGGELASGFGRGLFLNTKVMTEQNTQAAKVVSEAAPRPKPMTVYTVVGRGVGSRSYWQRVGSCFVNGDGSLKVLLSALPINGELVIKDNEA